MVKCLGIAAPSTSIDQAPVVLLDRQFHSYSTRLSYKGAGGSLDRAYCRMNEGGPSIEERETTHASNSRNSRKSATDESQSGP